MYRVTVVTVQPVGDHCGATVHVGVCVSLHSRATENYKGDGFGLHVHVLCYGSLRCYLL